MKQSMNPFATFANNIIKLIKQDGRIIDNIQAQVSEDYIYVYDSSIPFDENDVIERKLPSGKIECYTILNPVYDNGFGGISGFYKLEVRKTTTQPKVSSSIQINASGNAKVLVSSVDNSVNISSQDLKVFDELIDAVKKELRNNGEIVDLIVQMKNSIKDKESFKNKYKNVVQSLGDHVTVLTPFISVLTKFL